MEVFQQYAIHKMIQDPKIKLMAEANHLDNFTLANALTAYEHMVTAMGIDRHFDNADVFDALCDECYVKYKNYVVGKMDRNFTPSSSKTLQEVCRAVYTLCRSKK